MVTAVPPGFVIYRDGSVVVIADAKGSVQLRVGGDIGSSNPGVRLLGRLALALLEMDRNAGSQPAERERWARVRCALELAADQTAQAVAAERERRHQWSEDESVAAAHAAGFSGTHWSMGPEELAHLLNVVHARPNVGVDRP